MPDTLTLLQCLQPYIGNTSMRQLSQIVQAMLAMTGRVTMLGISRWTGKGGSYRTIQRFFNTTLPWATILWVFFRQYLWNPNEVYLLAGDEVVVTKAGKKTYGLSRFFASLHGKSVSGLSFFALSLISVKQRHSFPIRIEQNLKIKPEKEEGEPEKKRNKKQSKNKQKHQSKVSQSLEKDKNQKNKGGRPKGSKNKDKTNVELNPELLRIKGWIESLLKQLGSMLPVTYLLLDGHFGNNNAMQMTRQLKLHLISKLRYDSALYLPYENPEPEKKCRRKYGYKLKVDRIPNTYLKDRKTEKGYQTDIYQLELLHKEFSGALNVVIIVKTNIKNLATSHVILFSSDLDLAHEKLIDYYSLRFQIEFNFRDAKQFWGLEDFMNVSQTGVTQAANLSFFMVNASYYLLRKGMKDNKPKSILDLKTICRGDKYVREIVKLLPEKPDPVLLSDIFARICSLGRIHKNSELLREV